MSLAFAQPRTTSPRRGRPVPRRRTRNVAATPVVKPPLRRIPEFDWTSLVKTAADTFARGVLFLAFLYGAMHAYLFLTASNHFAVAETSLEGLNRLNRQQVLNWLPPLEGKNIFLLDLEQLTERLTAHPRILTAAVQRKWPNALTIQVQERHPYARVQLDRVFAMDNFGVLIAVDGEEFQSLPLIQGLTSRPGQLGEKIGSKNFLKGLKAMHFLNRLEFFKNDPVTAVQVSKGRRMTFSTRERGIKVHMASDRVKPGFDNLKILLNALKLSGTEVQSIDLSFENKVVILPGRGGAGHSNKT